MVLSTHEAVDRSLACTGMDSGVVPTDVSSEQGVELFQRMDSRDIKGRQPAAAEGPEIPFNFPFCSPISNRGMRFDNAQGIKDQGELVVFKRTAVIHVDLIWDAVSGNGLLEYFLIVVSVIVIKDPAADDQAGVVIDDHDQECPAGASVLGDIREVGCIRLPHTSEFRHFVSLPVFDGGIAGRSEIIFLQEALYGTDRDFGVDKAGLDEHLVDHDAVDAGKLLAKAIDLIDGICGESPGNAFVFAESGDEAVHSFLTVEAGPALKGIRAVFVGDAVRAQDGVLCDPAVVSGFAGIRIKPLDDRGDQCEAEMCDLQWFRFVFHEIPPRFVVITANGDIIIHEKGAFYFEIM